MATQSDSKDRSSQSTWPVWMDDNHMDCDWLASKTNIVASTCSATDISNARRRGATTRDGATLLLTLESASSDGDNKSPQRLVLKQITPTGQALSQQLGLAREALFYKYLAPQLPPNIVPRIYYSAGDMTTGLKCCLMQDLSKSWVDSGIFFGPGNPNNWPRDLPQLVATACPNQTPPTAAIVAETTFRAMARVHATFWNRNEFVAGNDYEWLRGQRWVKGEGRDSWEASQRLIQGIWAAYLEKEKEGDANILLLTWDPVVRAATSKAMAGVSWDKQLERLHVQGHWTLVHGDFWPGNVMWNTDESGVIRLLDWEMVGLGSGPQDLGQYVLSNMDPIERRVFEEQLVQAYYETLCNAGVNDKCSDDNQVTFEYCWNEYKIGGLERWLWFLVYFLSDGGSLDWAQFFHDQIAAFMKDHGLTEQDITQPRP